MKECNMLNIWNFKLKNRKKCKLKSQENAIIEESKLRSTKDISTRSNTKQSRL